MSKRISLKLTDKNDWLVKAIEKEQEETNRPCYKQAVTYRLVKAEKLIKTHHSEYGFNTACFITFLWYVVGFYAILKH
jgi:hypothetical protein